MNKINLHADVVLIGAGIMSATLGVMLKELNPELTIVVFEKLDQVALESSDAWNNAGTGHSAFCELNYTPQMEDGNIDVSKAIKIATAFEHSKEFWSYLIQSKQIINPEDFITQIPHMSFVWGDENISYLKKRYEELTKHTLFKDMKITEDRDQLMEWIPLIMEGRIIEETMAATRMNIGTDINFGAITRALFKYLESLDHVSIHLKYDVDKIKKTDDDHWCIAAHNEETNLTTSIRTSYVFIGAGGGTLLLLEKSNIKEAEGYGGFPISGQWLICNNQAVIDRHWAKVYGKAEVGSPPMSVPHLDTRFINGQKALFFGPFAGFSTRFLKHGSLWDLPDSIELENIKPMIAVGLHNIPLTKYLIQQVRLNHEDRMEALKKYMPLAISSEWELGIAGQRVQVIKKDDKEGGVLEFGTEIVCSDDGTLAALLGASPGASTAFTIMIDVLKKGFAKNMIDDDWMALIKKIIPSYNNPDDEMVLYESRNRTSEVLQLKQ
ncbi:MAG: malate dehydrogenase (quinone) [Saprospiraceae bacterium]